MSYVAWFEELSRKDSASAGGKGANLGELARAGLPVPPGFVVTVEAFRSFVRANGLASEIEARLESLPVDDQTALHAAAEMLQARIRRAAVPDDVRFGMVVSNPPIRIGKAALHHLLDLWLGRLTDDGEGWLVRFQTALLGRDVEGVLTQAPPSSPDAFAPPASATVTAEDL